MTDPIATFHVLTEADKDVHKRTLDRIQPLHELGVPLHVVCGTDIDFVMPVFQSKTHFNRWWNCSSGDGKWHFLRTSWESKLEIGDVISVYPAMELPEPPEQFFRQGISHCVFEPMRQLLRKKLEITQNKKCRSTINARINLSRDLERKHAKGVSEAQMQEVVDAMQIECRIAMVFAENNEPYKIFTPTKKALGKLCLINTKIHHVDEIVNTTTADKIILSPDALEEKRLELTEQGEWFCWVVEKVGGRLIEIRTLTNVYTSRTSSEYIELKQDFEDKLELFPMKLDVMQDRDVVEFMREGTHWNGELFIREPEPTEVVLEVDLRASYANYHLSPYYKGFPTKITDARATDRVQGPGIYRIKNIDWSNADPKFLDVCMLMGGEVGNIYLNWNNYPVPDLDLLSAYGVTYEVVEGVWAGGQEPSMDFRFPGDYEKETGFYAKPEGANGRKGVALYKMWVGGCMVNPDRRSDDFWMHGTDEFFAHVKKRHTNATVLSFKDGKGQIRMPKERVFVLPQVPAYINAHERILIILELMKIDLSSVVKLHKDAIFYTRHEEQAIVHAPYFKQDLKRPSTNRKVVNCYTSHVNITLPFSDTLLTLPGAQRDSWPVEAHLGVGGGGKTKGLLEDAGHVRVWYVAPPYKLTRGKQREYPHVKFRTLVLARALTRKDLRQSLINYGNVIIWDEISQYSLEQIKLALELFPYHKHFFAGDECQLPHVPIITPWKYDPAYQADKPLEGPTTDLAVVLAGVNESNILEPLYWQGTLSCIVKVRWNVYCALKRLKETDDFGCSDPAKARSQWKRLQNFLRRPCQQSEGYVLVMEEYKPASSGFRGRLYSGGCAGLNKHLRANILSETIDLDQCASAQTIIAYICRLCGVACPVVDEYVRDREGMLARIMEEEGWDRSKAKDEAIKVFMRDHLEAETPTLRRLDEEAKRIQLELSRVRALKWVLDSAETAKRDQGDRNVLGSFLSRAYQVVENKLTLAVAFGAAVHPRCLVFDGLAIERGVDVGAVIAEAEAICERMCPGLSIRWAKKEYDYSRLDFRNGPYDNIWSRSTAMTEENMRELMHDVGGYVLMYNYSFRCDCEFLRAIQGTLRQLSKDKASPAAIEKYVMEALASRIVTPAQAVDMYELEDMVLVSRITKPFEFVEEWTNALRPASGITKWLVRSTNNEYSNGDIVLGERPQNVSSEERHAFTVHSVQGETVHDKLFIDVRQFWEGSMWYTTLTRPRRLAQVFLIVHERPQINPAMRTAKIYKIEDRTTGLVYIGSTTKTLPERLRGHLRERGQAHMCTSQHILERNDYEMTLVEEFPCSSRQELHARETMHMNRHPTAVNKVRSHSEAFSEASRPAVPMPGCKRQQRLSFHKE